MTVLSRNDSRTTANNILANLKNVQSTEKDSPRTSESQIYHTNEGAWECQALDKWPTIRAVGERGEFVEEVESIMIEVGTK